MAVLRRQGRALVGHQIVGAAVDEALQRFVGGLRGRVLARDGLDGGQIVFLLCEKVKGSRLSERFMVNANIAGFVAILALMALVTYNDIKNVLF